VAPTELYALNCPQEVLAIFIWLNAIRINDVAMKIIFSRKGVDSQAGKLFSAIMNDRLISIPIPAGEGDKSKTRYRDLTIDGVSLARLVEDLSIRRNKKDRRCAHELVHFDPDLRRESLKRKPGWRPLLTRGK
jgi:hypothetical protein